MTLTFRKEIEYNGQRIVKEATIFVEKDEALTLETVEMAMGYTKSVKPEEEKKP